MIACRAYGHLICQAAAIVCLSAATSFAESTSDEIALFSFDAESLPSELRAEKATIRRVDGGALEISFRADVDWSTVIFSPATPWDCSGLGRCRFSFDATNPGDRSIPLHCRIDGVNGPSQTRQVAIPGHSSGTYYFELRGKGLTKDYGMRDDPASLEGVGTKMVLRGSKLHREYSKIRSIRFSLQRQLEDNRLIVDNLKLVTNPPVQADYLESLLDKFGQSAKTEFAGKIQSEEELQAAAREELRSLEEAGPMDDRGTYGGWKNGPKLKATGFFRTEKVGDKWALVDPEGYLYFATGIDNTRMANTATFTGVDFSDPTVRARNAEEVTPEDSLGIVPTDAAARKTRFVTSEMRNKMFTWLPDYEDPLAKHYGYRRSTHRGPVPHGEVFSFYRANLERRYGGSESGPMTTSEIEAKWAEVTVDRMLNWGFTSLGNWADPVFYHKNRIPYFANGWIIGDFKTLSKGWWRAMPDPYDPEFVRRAKVTLAVVAEEVQHNPWCVGVFVDNEMGWGQPGSVKKQYHIVLDALSRDAADSPTKAAFMRILRDKYSTIESLNTAWESDLASWDELARGVDHENRDHSEELVTDYSILLEAYASEYFRVVHDALEEVLPNQLYLGPRFASWGLGPEIRRAARNYCDVMCYNYYQEGLGKEFWSFLEETDMPSIIGEFHMGSTDTGFPNPGLVHAADQADRAQMWKAYMETVIDNPYFIGVHWFQYIDSPISGRAHDGENYNIGFVTVADVPYPHMIEAAKELHKTLYQRRYGDVAEE